MSSPIQSLQAPWLTASAVYLCDTLHASQALVTSICLSGNLLTQENLLRSERKSFCTGGL